MTKRNEATPPATDRILRPAEFAERLGYKNRQSIYTLVKLGKLPPPIKIGIRASGWRESTLLNYIRHCEVASQA